MTQAHQSIEFLQRKDGSIDEKIQNALKLYCDQQISPDILIHWISKSYSSDQSFRNSKYSWELFNKMLQDGNFKSDKFSILIKPADLLPVYNSDYHKLAFDVLELLVTKYPNAWRPPYNGLIKLISEMLKTVIHKDEVTLIMKIILDKPEVLSGVKSLFNDCKTYLLKPILEHAFELDMSVSFTLLSTFICVPFFVLKALNDLGEIAQEFINILNQYPNTSPSFAPYLIKCFFEQARLLNQATSLNFPLNIIESSTSLDIAVPLIHESNKMKIYVLQNDSPDLRRLKSLALRAVQEKHSKLLIELAHIDFTTVRPLLKSILPNPAIATVDLFLAIQQEIFLRKDPLILFECGDFPSHILSSPEFISQYCDGISHLTSKQLNLVLKHLVGYTERQEESTLLFWAIKSSRLTNEYIPIIEELLNDCCTNPWRFAAAVIAAKTLQLPLPEPTDFVTDAESHPVILECFLYENYGQVQFPENHLLYCLDNENELIPTIPSPYMNNSLLYRDAFIIKNIAKLALSIDTDHLADILNFIFKMILKARNMRNPSIIADYCLLSIHYASFYESEEIRNVFQVATLPLLPKAHLSSSRAANSDLSLEMVLLCAIISSLPSEFLTSKVSTAAFVGLFLATENHESMKIDFENLPPVFEEFNKTETLINCICLNAENLSIVFIQHNLNRIFSGCTVDSAIRLIPILLERYSGSELIKFPDLRIERPSQLIGVCDFCYEHQCPLPFDETLFADYLPAFCAQLRIGHPSTISLLLQQTEILPSQAPSIISALSDIRNTQCQFSSDFLQLLIMALLQNEEIDCEGKIDKRVISQFCTKLSLDLIYFFLDQAPLFYYPSILTSVMIKNEEQFEPFKKYFDTILKPTENEDKQIVFNDIPISILKTLCSIRMCHYYDQSIMSRLLFLIADKTNHKLNLVDACLLCNCVVLLLNNNNRELSKISPSVIEVVRKLSSLFTRSIAKEKPTYKNLKHFSKLLNAVAKAVYSDQIQYLLASFVVDTTNYNPSNEDQAKMKVLQAASFPLFSKCSKDQLNEIKASLHDSHREIFEQLGKKWQEEAQYKGKV